MKDPWIEGDRVYVHVKSFCIFVEIDEAGLSGLPWALRPVQELETVEVQDVAPGCGG